MSRPKHGFLHDLFLKHAHEVSAFIRRRWPREQDVDNIMQESFLRLSQAPNPETILNPRAFLFTTASNMAVDRHRRRKNRVGASAMQERLPRGLEDIQVTPYIFLSYKRQYLSEMTSLKPVIKQSLLC